LNKQRNTRRRMLIRRLNNIRHEHAKKIDILCNDMVSAHGEFINQLNTLKFSVDFYESIVGWKDLSSLLNIASELIKKNVPNINISIFLLGPESFELHMADKDNPIEINSDGIESCFTLELVRNICRSNSIYSLDDMLEMGLCGDSAVLGKMSAAAVPLGRFGDDVGFILIYRNGKHEISFGDIQRISGITGGLCKAIKACQPECHAV